MRWLLWFFFGHCPHRHLSIPLGPDSAPYRVCAGCGARRRLDPDTWEYKGRFYFEVATR